MKQREYQIFRLLNGKLPLYYNYLRVYKTFAHLKNRKMLCISRRRKYVCKHFNPKMSHLSIQDF
jgi:hypothetical protein